MNDNFEILIPNWSIPNIRAYTVLAFTKNNNPVDFSIDSFLGGKCREKLEDIINPKYSINWFKQIHSNNIIELPVKGNHEADGSFTAKKGVVCEVITADCLPIVFSNLTGTKVGIVHAGRKGLYNNIISNFINKFNLPTNEILVWIGPGISQDNYSVTKDIKGAFTKMSVNFSSAFKVHENGECFMSLYEIAKLQLTSLGISGKNIYGAEWDTYSSNLFHSARRDKNNSGRMATVVWIEAD